MRFNAFIWDFDGTLADTYPRMTHAYQTALTKHGISAGYDDLLSRIKRSARAAAAHYSTAAHTDAETLIAEMITAERRVEGGMDLYPGAYSVCRAIAQNGGRNFLYTHRNIGAVEALRTYNALDFFTDCVTEEDHFPHKPAPDAICHLLEKHNINQSDAIMIGDRDIDLEAGHNAGISGCLFDPDGFYDELAADFRVKALEEMVSLFDIFTHGTY